MTSEVLKKQVCLLMAHQKKMCLQCNLFIFLVGRELQTLHSLRRMFVNDLRARVRRAQVTSFQVILNQ